MPPRLFQVQTAQSHSQPIRSMSVGPCSGRVFATGGDDCFLNLYSVTDENPIYHFGPFESAINCSVFHYSEDLIAFGTNSGHIQIIDLDSRKTITSWHIEGSQITCIDYHPLNIDHVAVGDADGHVFLLSAQERNPIQQYQAHRGNVTCIKFSPDGNLLASSGSDRLIRIFQILSGECFNTIRINCPQFLSLDFHPIEMVLAGCSDDRSVHIFSFDPDQINELKGSFIIGNASPQCVKFSKDGKVLASCSSSVLSVFRTFAPDFVDHMQISQKKVHDMQLYSTCVAIATSEGNIGKIIFAKTDDFRLLKKEVIVHEKKGKSSLQNKVIDGSNLMQMKKTQRRIIHPIKGLADLQPKPSNNGPAANDVIYRNFKAKRPDYLAMLETRKTKLCYLFDRIKSKGSLFTINEIATTGDAAFEFVAILQMRPQTVNIENAAKCIEIMKFAFDDDPNLTVNALGLVLEIIGPSLMSNKDSNDLIEIFDAIHSIGPYVVDAANSGIEEAKSLLATWEEILM